VLCLTRSCEDTLEFYIKNIKYHMEQDYYQATGKPLEWDDRDEYMSRMYDMRSLTEGFLDSESKLQLFLEMQNRMKINE